MNDEKTQAIDHLAAMRLLTEWTGQVSENQVKTLNLWPSVMLQGVKSHRVAINLDEHKVVFHLNMKPGKVIKDLTPLTRIESGVWALLGDTWYTMVRAGKKVVYAGTRRKEFKLGQFNSAGSGRKGPDAEGKGSVSKVRRGK
jgi:hypothetical protein